MEEIEDYDMECEQICTEESTSIEGNAHDQNVPEERPATPLNISGVTAQNEDKMKTPPNASSAACSNLFLTPNYFDVPFIKRIDTDKLMMDSSRAMPASTSTPLMANERLSNTLPLSFAPPSVPFSRRVRQCLSAENVRRHKMNPDLVPYQYINPFTPDGKLLTSKLKARKFQRMSLGGVLPKLNLNDSSDSETHTTAQPSQYNETVFKPEINLDDIPRRARLKDFNVTRFNEEFLQLQEIGKGDHGCVYKCLNRLNGCLYAIKKTLKPIKTGNQERTVRNEIYAHGVLFHPNIVRNFSCWKEEEFVFIQNEFCNGGNLETYMESNTMSETLLRSLLFQIASALKYMHYLGLAHMDVKPANILLSIERDSSLESDGGFSDDEKTDGITFKIGDLGHVSRLDEDDAEEGDCRYLSREIIEEKYTHLDRADVFALALTVYEAAGGGPLPKNGDEWHEIRNGNLRYLQNYTKEFNDMLKNMIDPAAEKRPSAADLVKMLRPPTQSPILDDVSSYIHQYRRTNTHLETTALATDQYLKALFKSNRQMQEQLQNKEKVATPSKDKPLSLGKKKGGVTKSRVVGRKTKRSSSTTTF